MVVHTGSHKQGSKGVRRLALSPASPLAPSPPHPHAGLVIPFWEAERKMPPANLQSVSSLPS